MEHTEIHSSFPSILWSSLSKNAARELPSWARQCVCVCDVMERTRSPCSPKVYDNDNNEYISKALNPSTSDLDEAKSAVHVQLKPSKQTNQQHNEKSGDGWVEGQGPNIKYTTNYTLHNSLSQTPFSLSLPPPLPLSLPLQPISSPIIHSPSHSPSQNYFMSQSFCALRERTNMTTSCEAQIWS